MCVKNIFDLDKLKIQINELLEVVKTGNKEMIKKGIELYEKDKKNNTDSD